MAGTKKINKAKARAPVVATFEVLQGMDGNPNTPQEFDESHPAADEVFFKADDGATQADKNKVHILNFIHQELHHGTQRKVPVLTEKDNPDIEIYHRVKYHGVDLDVCVYWPPREESDFKSCIALVKYSSDDLSDEHGENGVISTDASWNEDAKADKFTVKNDKLKMNYWAPRWKYIVNALRNTAYNRYDKHGVYIPEPELKVATAGGEDDGPESQEEREEQMEVYCGSTGKIIGLKGAKIQEIRKASNVTDIKMPAKSEDGPRPRARDLVSITIVGKGRSIKIARDLIQAVVDEWANAPRPPRDGGYGGGFTQSDTVDNDHGGGGDDNGGFGGGDNENLGTSGGVGDSDTGGVAQSWDSAPGGGW